MNEKSEHGQPRISVGVDIGGTKISAGLVKDKKVLTRETVPTPNTGNQKEITECIFSVIEKVASKEMAGIGIGVPGLVDTKAGITYDIQNIPALNGIPLKKILASYWEVPVSVNNDANCFALGAKNFLNGKNFLNLIGLSIGTGIGGGIVINGQLYEGVGCGAGEFGFLPYRDGVLEQYCSGQFFRHQYGITGEKAASLALQGDKDALQMFDRFGYHLGKAIKMITHVFAPEVVILGGSISKSFQLFEQSMWSEIRNFPYSHVADKLEILPVFNSDISIVGAALLIENKNIIYKASIN